MARCVQSSPLIPDGVKGYAPSVTASAMMLPVNIHELLGMGLRAARLEKGWRQQDASNEYRAAGLRTWTPLAVGQVENGTRKPGIGDYLLACTAVGKSLADLVPDLEDEVELGPGASIKASAIKAILGGRSPDELPPKDFRTPGDKWLAEALARSQAVRDRLEPHLEPIWDRAGRIVMREDTRHAFMPPTEAEQRAAGRLGVLPAQVKAAARVLWSRDFEEERDARVGEGAVAAQSLQARRGHASRAMLGELRGFLRDCGISGDDDGGSR